ncbi:MAG TPA: FHA domain-containing protein [Leptolyngbyaceae cyanobacterium]
MRIQLTWTDPNGQQRQPILETPIALGSDFDAMPTSHEGQRVSRLVLPDSSIAGYHALIEVRNDTPLITTPSGQNIQINGLTLPMSTLFEGDVLQIGSLSLALNLSPAEAPTSSAASPIEPTAVEPTTVNPALMGMAPMSVPQSGGSSEGNLGPEGCDRKVGFLFKRRCGRTSRDGCPYCDSGQSSGDPYPYFYSEYSSYPGYGTYHRGYWGHDYYAHRHDPGYYSNQERADFTEADAAAFESENDQDYEMDMGAS